MKVDDLLEQSGEWLRATGPEVDVVISSRVRMARNLHRYPFLTMAAARVRTEIEKHIRARLEDGALPYKLTYWSLAEMPLVDRMLLVERHLISREHAQADGDRGVGLLPDETVSIMVNEEDHLRCQALRSGFQVDEAYDEIDKLDTALEQSLHFAFDPQFGYLTACPTNVGTGMRLSVMMHLPATAVAKQVDKAVQSLQRVGYAVRGFYGEGTSPLGDFYQVSNQVTLGKTERELVDGMKKVVPEVIRFERQLRYKLMEDEPRKMEDKVWRAYGILKHARRITSEEATEFLSSVRLGLYLKILPSLSVKTVHDLFLLIQPGHLQKLEGKELEPEERDAARAEFIRRKLEEP